jgi:hypothetical protein
MKNPHGRLALSFILAAAGLAVVQSSATAQQKPFQLGVEERGYIQDPNNNNMEYGYPAPQAIPTPQYDAGVSKTKKPPKKPLKGNLQENVPQRQQIQQRPPMQMQVQQSQPLPQGFMGAWLVSGLRKDVKAQPQFQAAIPTIFAEQTQNVWNITGNPSSGYAFSNDSGVKSAIFVDKVEGGTAFIRYQHPIKNTMAKEAIVMQIVPGGIQFNGLERISIMKQGEPQPRAEVTYQLMGRRKQ